MNRISYFYEQKIHLIVPRKYSFAPMLDAKNLIMVTISARISLKSGSIRLVFAEKVTIICTAQEPSLSYHNFLASSIGVRPSTDVTMCIG